jgi:hypothetical protein
MSTTTINPNTSMLVDIQYVRANKRAGTPDCLYTIYKDLETGKKHVMTMENPSMPIYFEKEEFIDHKYPQDYKEKDKCKMEVVKYKDIPFVIAEHMGDSGKAFLQNIFETRNYAELSMINTYPYVFGHDYDIRTYYRHAWKKRASENIIPQISKSFLDIECDSFDSAGFPNPQNNPIDLVTVIDGEKKKSYTFALVNRQYKPATMYGNTSPIKSDKMNDFFDKKEEYRKKMYDSRHEQEKALMNDLDGLKKELHEMFDETYGSFDYNFYFYEDEREMLIHLFQCIHMISPDFLMIWNISFDIPYILERMRTLGINPEDIICEEEFKAKECYFKKDMHNFEIKNKCDWFHVTSKTVYIDQMELYAAVRKGREELRSTKLNFIGEKEVNDSKLDYSEDGNIKTVGYVNYRRYFIYNIKDVLLQYGIERSTEDCETLYTSTYSNITAYEDNFKQTVTLRNVQYRIYDDFGLIPGANINQILLQRDMRMHPEKYDAKNKKKDPSYEGALVGNTLLIQRFGKMMYGKRTNYMFDYSIDFDMKAFYPSTIYVLNIAPSTLIFKATVLADNYDVRGGDIPFHGFTDNQLVKTNNDSFTGDIASEIFDNFQTGNILSTAHKFLNLPTVAELEKELCSKLGKQAVT